MSQIRKPTQYGPNSGPTWAFLKANHDNGSAFAGNCATLTAADGTSIVDPSKKAATSCIPSSRLTRRLLRTLQHSPRASPTTSSINARTDSTRPYNRLLNGLGVVFSGGGGSWFSGGGGSCCSVPVCATGGPNDNDTMIIHNAHGSKCAI